MNDNVEKRVKKLEKKISKLESNHDKLEKKVLCVAIIFFLSFMLHGQNIKELENEINELNAKKEE